MKSKITYYLSLLSIFSAFGLSYGQSDYPVSLSSPMDFDTIIETEPTLVWQIDIQGITSDPRYSQRLVLCELLENQTKGDAIVLNTPLVLQNDYQNSTYSYNSSTDPLQMGHTYAWQVQVLFNGMQVDQSDVFQFTLYSPPLHFPNFFPVVFNNSTQNLPVEEERIGIVTREMGTLNLKLNIVRQGVPLNQQFYLKEYVNGQLIAATSSSDQNSKRYFVLDLNDYDLDAGLYTVTWIAKSGKKYTFNFQK